MCYLHSGSGNQVRRPRKRLWTPNRFESSGPSPDVHSKDANEPQINRSSAEKPLELTTKPNTHSIASTFSSVLSQLPKNQKIESEKPRASIENQMPSNDSLEAVDTKIRGYSTANMNETVLNEPSAASLPPSDLVMPPIWYPPLYPPYGIDPLHFFIDLRVSGHIYDRKKENNSPSSTTTSDVSNSLMNLENNNQIGKARHGSAFSVPPRRDQSPLALNLSSSMSHTNKTNVVDYENNNNLDASDDKLLLAKNTNYVLQNLPRIYTSLNSTQNPYGDDRHSIKSEESDSNKSGSEIDVKDHEQISNISDDVVIVDQDSDTQPERKMSRRKLMN